MLTHLNAIPHFAPAVRIVAVPIRAVPSRCSAAHGCSVHSQFISTQSNTASPHSQSYQCPAVAPADHCVTVRARPSQCKSDHLMTPAFRLTSGHNPCSVIPCKTAHPQSLRISRPRSRLSSPSRPLPRPLPRLRFLFACLLIASALPIMSRPCCALPWQLPTQLSCASAIRIDAHRVVALADLFRVLLYICIPMPIDADRCAQHPVSKLLSPMPSHRPASRFAAVRISAFQRSLAALLRASRPLRCITPHHTVSLRITHCCIKHTRALLCICFPGLNKALSSLRVPMPIISLPQPRPMHLQLVLYSALASHSRFTHCARSSWLSIAPASSAAITAQRGASWQ